VLARLYLKYGLHALASSSHPSDSGGIELAQHKVVPGVPVQRRSSDGPGAPRTAGLPAPSALGERLPCVCPSTSCACQISIRGSERGQTAGGLASCGRSVADVIPFCAFGEWLAAASPLELTCAWQDSNLRPLAPKPSLLSVPR